MAKKKTTAKKVAAKSRSGARGGGERSGGAEVDASMRVVVLHGKETMLQSLYQRRLREQLEEKFGGWTWCGSTGRRRSWRTCWTSAAASG